MTTVRAEPGPVPEPSPWWIECSETLGIDQVLALAAPSARHLVQLAPGRLRLRLFRLKGPGVEVDGGWANLPLRVVGTTPPKGNVTVTFVLHAKGRCTMHGHDVRAGSALLWPAGLDYDSMAPAGYCWVTLIVPEVAADAFVGSGAMEGCHRGTDLCRVTLPPREQAEVRDLLRAVRAWRKPEIADLEPRACRDLRERWYDLLGWVLRASAPIAAREPRAARATGIVRAVEEWFLENLDSRLRLPDASAAAGVSVRSMQTAFRRIVDMPPVRYLETLRAHALFLEVRREGPGAPATVKDAEQRCGVFHPSRFAGRYRAVFGEYPSETLAAAQRARSR